MKIIKTVKLDPRPSRLVDGDLTDREIASLLGGFIGNLCNYTDTETVRRAVLWWAQSYSNTNSMCSS